MSAIGCKVNVFIEIEKNSNIKYEFNKEKNLWDSFLDILADGAHQSPTENVMMSRWIEGEKGDLK